MTVSTIAPYRPLVLFVEGEPSLRKHVTSHLTNLGMDVVAIGNGDIALSIVREQRPRLVCLDVNLPRMSGHEVCEQIRRVPELYDLVVLMTSNDASPEARAYSYEAGATAYLSKPYTLDRLAHEVRRLLEPAPADLVERWSSPVVDELSLKLA